MNFTLFFTISGTMVMIFRTTFVSILKTTHVAYVDAPALDNVKTQIHRIMLTRFEKYSRRFKAAPAAVAAALSAFPAIAQSHDPARPNLLWIIAEDMTYNDLGCYGNPDVRTPNIDNFAGESVRYTNAFTTGAVSSATRSGLITGMYQTSIGAHNHRTPQEDKKPLPDGVLPITYAIRSAGYLTVLCAHENLKWGKNNPGPWGSGKTDFNFKFPEKDIFDAHNWSEAKPGQPFFAHLTLLASHRGAHWREGEAREGGLCPDSITTIAPYYPVNDVSRNDYAAYYDAIQWLDRSFGEIIARLEREGILDNTIIVFMSDHGRPMPRDKQFCWDGGIHVPLMVRYPDGRHAGTVNDKLVSSIDVSAQMIQWSGAGIPGYVQGVPFADPKTPDRRYTVSARDRCDETVHRIRAIHTKDYLYIRNFDPEVPYTAQNRYKDTRYPILRNMRELYAAGELPANCMPFFAARKPAEQLYDMHKDPFNLHDLASDPAMAKVLEQMRGYLDEWLSHYPDMGRYPESGETMSRIMEDRVKQYGY